MKLAKTSGISTKKNQFSKQWRGNQVSHRPALMVKTRSSWYKCGHWLWPGHPKTWATRSWWTNLPSVGLILWWNHQLPANIYKKRLFLSLMKGISRLIRSYSLQVSIWAIEASMQSRFHQSRKVNQVEMMRYSKCRCRLLGIPSKNQLN